MGGTGGCLLWSLVSGWDAPSYKYRRAVVEEDSRVSTSTRSTPQDQRPKQDFTFSHERTFFYRVDGSEQPAGGDRPRPCVRTHRLWDSLREPAGLLLQDKDWKRTRAGRQQEPEPQRFHLSQQSRWAHSTFTRVLVLYSSTSHWKMVWNTQERSCKLFYMKTFVCLYLKVRYFMSHLKQKCLYFHFYCFILVLHYTSEPNIALFYFTALT